MVNLEYEIINNRVLLYGAHLICCFNMVFV